MNDQTYRSRVKHFYFKKLKERTNWNFENFQLFSKFRNANHTEMGKDSLLDIRKFQMTLLKNGMQYDENDATFLLKTAKQCAKTAGIPLGAAVGTMSASAGAVAVPLIGSVPGWVVGALAGFASGTLACTMSKAALKGQLDALLLKK